ncbi:BNR repeat-like domain-containing protein [Cyclobacterium xiamenense]|uniref:BNR repeat-like domain-containing protein n=1 Tax=Cyclobacterium xiamenense TaxID=1297121 RepID=A0A1H6WXT4_9BACT|nr:sialidase family protein [Cyclobacterium xiamenense]SEJ20676.1 BNR repeat-like domain-containing protein [Cyclobacterium xiamenense]
MKTKKRAFTLEILLLIALAIQACGGGDSRQGSKVSASERQIERKLVLNPGEDNPRNSEGDFIALKDGRLLFVYSHYYGESSSDHATAFLAGRYSSDQGETWTTEDEEILPNEGGMNVMSVSLLRLQNGDIALFYLRKNDTDDCIPMMRISKDETKTWSEPIPCITDKEGYFVLNNDRVIQVADGRLLLAVARHAGPGMEWSGKGDIFSYYSDDNGQTWQSSEEVPNPEGIVLQEPGLVELKDGSILMVIRSNAGVQCYSYSRDRGKTWSQVEKSSLVSPVSPATIERIPGTGDLLAVWNNNLSEDPDRAKLRTPLNAAISRDDGKTWENVKTLEDDPDGWYCYIAMEFVGEEVMLGYCAGNRPAGTGLSVTNLSKVSMDWLYEQN